MTLRTRGVLLALGLALLPLAVWTVAGVVRAREENRRSVTEQSEMRAGLCSDEGKKYSHGALLRTKSGSVVKCEHGRWIDPSKPR